jgi:hypothetical protein
LPPETGRCGWNCAALDIPQDGISCMKFPDCKNHDSVLKVFSDTVVPVIRIFISKKDYSRFCSGCFVTEETKKKSLTGFALLL